MSDAELWIVLVVCILLMAGISAAWWRFIWWQTAPMTIGSRRHRHHLATLHREAVAHADDCRAYQALSDDDRAWLEERGWEEPGYYRYLILNRLDIDQMVQA